MKLFTKLGFVFLVMLISSSVLWAQSSTRDIAPKKQTYTIASEALFDLQFDWPVGVGGGEAGIETDGNYIYTTKWNGADFYQYNMDGAYISSFTIGGATSVRDLAFNGTYFYGSAATTTVFEMDFSGQSLVSSFTAPTECRAIAYNEDDDAFYANNWGSAITKFDMAGTNLGSFAVGPVGDSYYGFAYDNYSTGAPYLWGYAQVGATNNELVQIELPGGAETGVYFDVATVAAVGAGIAGGMAIDDNLFTGYWTILGTSQNVCIWGLELCPSGAQPTNDVGVMTIVDPSSGVNLTASEPVTVTIKNFGTAAQSNFDVSFTLDGGTPFVETITATINSGDTYDHTFANTVDLSAYGTYNFESCTDLAGDENPGNDCKIKVVENSEPGLCVPVYTTGCTYGDGFTDFALEEIENYGSGCADLNGPGWSQYFGLGPANLEGGNTYDVIMATGYANNFTSIWIDFNDDLDLTSDEMVLNNFEMVTAGQTYTVPIDIPAGVPDGQHIMRARTNWNETCDDPCASYAYGEAEDYYVQVGVSVTGNLDGTVTAVGGGAIEGATVILQGTAYSATTIANGTYEILSINVGDYTAECSASGYITETAPVTIEEGITTTQDFELEEASILDPPTNLTATFVPEDDIYLDWVAPGGGPTGSILCVDRDGSADVGFTDDWPVIQAALDANALTYDYYEVADITQDGPDLATMQDYDLIIWFTGECWQNNQTMTDNDEANLGTFIAGGGNLLLSAQDYFFDRYSSAGSFSAGQFPYDYLGVASTTQDNWNIFAPDLADVSGVAGSFADGITFQVQDIYTTDKEGLYIDQITSLDQDLFEVTNPTPAGIAACQYNGGSFRTAFTTISLAAVTDAGILATIMGNAVSWLSGGDSDALLGYNVYRDGTDIDYVAAPTTEYTDENLAPGIYEYCVTAVYDEGESACSNNASAEVPGGGGSIFCDDFESYNVGDQLVCVNPDDWTTWSGTPCNNEDPYIVDDGSNVVEITGTNDLIHVMENYTSGFYTMTFDMLVPTGGDGYFNTLQEFDPTPTWGMQVYFGHTNLGEGNIDAGGALAQMFTFDYDTWMAIKVTVDLDNDWGEFFLDGVLIHGWVWSSGCFGTGTLNQLGGNNFYAWDGGVNGNPLYHFDNYCLGEPQSYIFCDDFESYNVGDQLVCVNPDDWTTWSGTPCNNEDPYIVDDGSNVVEITGTNDLVYVMENYTSGFYTITFDMLVPTGGDGYFNTLQNFAGSSSEWGMQVYFGHTNLGEGNIDAGGALAQMFTFDYDTWMAIKVTVDLDNDWGEFFLDDVLIHGWVWSGGCFGTGTLNQLGASNFYAWDGGVNGNPLYHFDNYCLDGDPTQFLPPENPVATLFDLVNVHFTWDPPLSGDPNSYNVFRDGTNIGNTTNTEYDDLNLDPGTYEYCVSAVYDGGESIQVCADPVTVPGSGPPPPTNLEAVEGINGVDLTWEGIGGAEWIQWDDGENVSAVGLTNGGTFSVASHWEPGDLTNYNGYILSKISFFPSDEYATYILKVWTGPSGTTEVLSQALTTFNVGEWNEVDLDNPVAIDASTDFWFGYETTHLAGNYPAGCAAGPAIQGKGDMILTGGSWESLYVLTGGALDYNWNIAGYVELSDGIVTPLIGHEVTLTLSGDSFASALESVVTNNQYSKFIPSSTKDLSYNVYFKPEGGEYSQIANTVNTYYTHTDPVIGWNYYYVTSLLNGDESVPSNEDSVLITGIEENLFNNTQVYPNPATDMVNIKSDFEINTVMVYNYAGQIVVNEQVNSKFYQINTSQYNAGIYFFKIETDEGTISKRIIIK